jgi:hypothetical protein
MRAYDPLVITATAQPLWPAELTAWGTLAVAVAAVTVALFAEWRADVRVNAERAHSDKQLAEERAAADARLQRQLNHSAAQLQAERDQAREREQQVSAWAVRVGLAWYSTNPNATAKRLLATVTNNGTYPIVEIAAQFSPDGRTLVPPYGYIYGPAPPGLLTATIVGMPEPVYYAGILTSGGSMSFASDIERDPEPQSLYASDPYEIVRWRDHWGQQWEEKKGKIRKANDGEEWLA